MGGAPKLKGCRTCGKRCPPSSGEFIQFYENALNEVITEFNHKYGLSVADARKLPYLKTRRR